MWNNWLVADLEHLWKTAYQDDAQWVLSITVFIQVIEIYSNASKGSKAEH